MSGERFLRVSSERFAFRDSQSPAVSVVSGGVPESPPPGSFPQEECGSGFFGLSVIHPLGVIVDIYRGAPPCYERERPTNELPTLDPLGSRVGPKPTRWSGLYWVVLGDLPVGVTNNAYTGLPQ